MSSIKKLAGQTLWYGIPTIVNRFLGYLLNFSLPLIFPQPADTADLSQVFAIIPFLNVLFTYGVETAYFRFSQEKDRNQLYNTLSISIFSTTILFTLLLLFFRKQIATAAALEDVPVYITFMCWILFFDTLTTLPFARLRQENRPRKYAFVRVAGTLTTILVVVLFMGVIPAQVEKNSNSFLNFIYNKDFGIGYYMVGYLAGSMVTFLLLATELKELKLEFNSGLWKEVMKYSYPLIIVGLGGMVNDVLSRLIYQQVVDLPPRAAKHEFAIFSNIYRLAVLVTIMIQAFRMAAEPFFFSKAKDEDAAKTYARVMKFFVIACCFMFLLVGLYLDVLKWFITLTSDNWGEGIYIVPLLALGNIFLGIYYNLSIWYKLTNKNMYGAYITIAGAVVTILLNILLIPKWHYLGAAVATFVCYLFMMVLSYKLGQKYYPVPYARKKLTSYIVLVVLMVLVHMGLQKLYTNLWFSTITATLFFALFTAFVIKIERKELKQMPFIGKFIK